MPERIQHNVILQPFTNEAALIDWLTAFEGTPMSSSPVLQQMVDTLGSPENYRCLIQSILANDEWISDIAYRSVIKGQGFLKLVVTTTSAMTLRLHVYVPCATFDSGYHNHRWDFASKVLYGTLTQHFATATSREDDSGNAIQSSVLLFSRDGKDVSWEEAGMAFVTRTKTLTVYQGSSYYLDHERIHMIPNPEHVVHLDYVGAVTMFIHGPQVKLHGSTFWPPGTKLPEDGELQTLEVEHVKQIFCHLLNLFESGLQLIKFVENCYYKH